MVDISSQEKKINIKIQSGSAQANVSVTQDTAQYYSEKSREWATSNRIVDNTDYSSKYYAEKSKESEAKAENYERSVIEKYNSFVEVSNQAETELQTLKDDSISQINTVASSGISDIANKTSEAITSLNTNIETATSEINNVKNNAVTQLSKEAQEQLKNIESTGFYMRDDKLYFINSKGEEEEFKSGAGAVMFDTKISDHILEGNEAIGWALQGTYVSCALYPDFYGKCLEEKNNATATETTLGESTLTMFVNSNGHQFYDISDKEIVDTFYDTFGIADFYGIDEVNERVFLPRNKYFAIRGDAFVVGNGKTLGLTNGDGERVLGTVSNPAGCLMAMKYQENLQSSQTSNTSAHGIYGVTSDPEKSGIVANLKPNESKYLYYCVGNTVVNDSEIDAGGLVAQMEQKANITLDNVLPTQEFKIQSVSWGMPDYDSGVSVELNTDIVAPYPCFVTAESKANTNGLAAISLSVKVNNQYLPVGVSYSIVSGYSSSAVVGGFFAKGQTFRCVKGSGNTYSAVMYPLKGVN